MWPWRKRSPFEDLGLPTKVFISHSYKDDSERELLLALLPRHVEPFVFPPITVPPEQMISDKLLDAIRSCRALIYLLGRASADSFWVALERDYALRMGKPVFAFDPATRKLTRDTSSPLDLQIVATYAPSDADEVRDILVFMRDERSFDIHDIGASTPLTAIEGVLKRDERVFEIIREGGYVTFFWSGRSDVDSDYSLYQTRGQLIATADDQQSRASIVDALLDRDDAKQYLYSYQVRDPVQLYGDRDRSRTQRLDDLIVRLYWLIYRNTRQNQLS